MARILWVFVFGSGLLGNLAQAERFIVTFKDPAAFSQVHSQFVLQQVLELNKVSFFSALDQGSKGGEAAPVTVEDSLKNLGSVVIDTADKTQVAVLKASGLIESVEAETFYPAPRPVSGFKATSPWASMGLQIQQMNPDDHLTAPASATAATNRTPYGINLVRAPQAWGLAGRGQGARVLVLDTGLDVNHPVIKDNFEKGRDFTRTIESSDVTDTVGHGTHVAGTVVGSVLPDGFSGVAPEAHLLMGRVCSIRGCSNIAVARGINWGIEEKVDVISMSLGGNFSTKSEQRAVQQAEEAGITVIAATGNSGTPHVGLPAAFPTVIAVGAVNAKEERASFSQYGAELDIMAPGAQVMSTVPTGKGRDPFVEVTTAGVSRPVASALVLGAPVSTAAVEAEIVELNRADAVSPQPMSGKIALVEDLPGKLIMPALREAVNAGASAILLFGPVAGLPIGGSTLEDAGLPIPMVFVERSVALELRQQMSLGAQVFGKVRLAPTDYASFDGTSMAAPHVAGVAALVKAANKNLTPQEVRDILGTTAKQIGIANEYGKGLVDAEAAVKKALGI